MVPNSQTTKSWTFWVDRGGTFTDIIAKDSSGLLHVHKLLSVNPEHYEDATAEGINYILKKQGLCPATTEINSVKIGTTIATNALLERLGEPTVLVVSQGFGDSQVIAYQNRPDLFALEIKRPEPIYDLVVEAQERINFHGQVLQKLDSNLLSRDLELAFNKGIRSCAISFMHAYLHPQHEQQAKEIAYKIGFKQVYISSEVSPLIKYISRTSTTLADAYLSGPVQSYGHKLSIALPGIDLLFMQSNGGLGYLSEISGKSSILSGPAGGIVASAYLCKQAGFNKIISFDMGGTSTDVAHYNGVLESDYEIEISGLRLKTPVLSVHTVASGGGSISYFDGERFRCGPQSAGANPGPACYGKGGPLTITDCNLVLGKIKADHFPNMFGKNGNEPLNESLSRTRLEEIQAKVSEDTTQDLSICEIAEGFITIAIQQMANAIASISIEKGHDIRDYALCSFGGAAGQHACLLAEVLGIESIYIHPLASVLSAAGIGIAPLKAAKQSSLELELNKENFAIIKTKIKELEAQAKQSRILDSCLTSTTVKFLMRYTGSDTSLEINSTDLLIDKKNDKAGSNDIIKIIEELQRRFEHIHSQRFGFTSPDKPLTIETLLVELEELPQPSPLAINSIVIESNSRNIKTKDPSAHDRFYYKGQWHDCRLLKKEDLEPKQLIAGPAIICDTISTIVVEPGWQASLTNRLELVIQKIKTEKAQAEKVSLAQANPMPSQNIERNPIELEIFHGLFKSCAEQMGLVLQNTSHSVNIKERLDFSCALFDEHGNLVANAPHIPVHLGSMSQSVQSLIVRNKELEPGQVYISNNPYNGGTHLPDITVITPVFTSSPGSSAKTDSQATNLPLKPWAFVASRGHHADIGGATPGSMPPFSQHINEEGILFDNELIAEKGIIQEEHLLTLLAKNAYPARSPQQNLSDLKAQIAANNVGSKALLHLCQEYGLAKVKHYMEYVQENAASSIRRVISKLEDGSYICTMDDGSKIKVAVKINKENQTAIIDFTGTSAQNKHNLNAPRAITMACVLYVLRLLCPDQIPLNSGCLRPVQVIIPEGSMLSPNYPAAVCAGNVETSQIIVDALLGALNQAAASQGTMNNLTFGNDKLQYYETICGGTGAGPGFHGASAVQSHMTNSRLTDPEILESRFPVLLEEFKVRTSSGGIGTYSGGNGVVRKLRFLKPLTAAIISGRRTTTPFGLQGGKDGLSGKNYVLLPNSKIEGLSNIFQRNMQADEVLVIETPGGGGFGIPKS